MKAILMMNELPEECWVCPCYRDKEFKEGLCLVDYKDIKDREKRPEWCPLIEINDNIARLIEVAR